MKWGCRLISLYVKDIGKDVLNASLHTASFIDHFQAHEPTGRHAVTVLPFALKTD